MAKTTKTAETPNGTTHYPVPNLTGFTQADLDKLVATFKHRQETNEGGVLDSTAPLVPADDGFVILTPAIAEAMLLRAAGNRRVHLSDVLRYIRQMRAGQWRRTGESMSISDDKRTMNGSHRCWAVYLGGGEAPVFVVAKGVDASENLFAFFDQGRNRSAGTVFQIAGIGNGQAAQCAKVVEVAEDIAAGIYTPARKKAKSPADKLTPAELLDLATVHPNVEQATALLNDAYRDVVKLACPQSNSQRKAFIGWFAMKVIDQFGLETLEAFFDEVQDDSTRPVTDPVGALRDMLQRDAMKPTPMQAHTMGANFVRAFNAWRLGQQVTKRWGAGAHEPWPELDTGEMAEAAE